MANKKINQLKKGTNSIVGTDIIPMFSDGQTETNTVDSVCTYCGISKDSYLTGSTLSGNTLSLNRNQGLSTISVDLSPLITSNDSFVTGSTLNGTTLEIDRNQGLPTISVELSGVTSGISPFEYSPINVTSIQPVFGNNTAGTYIQNAYSTIAGGSGNTMAGGLIIGPIIKGNFIGAGVQNYMGQAHNSVIGGGFKNHVDTTFYVSKGIPSVTFYGSSFIGGGQYNRVEYGFFNNVIGGYDNKVTGGTYTNIGGGARNFIKDSSSSAIIGGTKNTLNGTYAAEIVGGYGNTITGTGNWVNSIVGGYNNTIDGSTYGGFIGNGGQNTLTSSNNSSIIGGYSNTITSSNSSSIIGGVSHNLNSNNSTIIGGGSNVIGSSSLYTSIGGGLINVITNSNYSSINGGGRNNINSTIPTWQEIWATGNRSHNFIGGGLFNNIIVNSVSSVGSDYSNVIAGGFRNTINSGTTKSSILGGELNINNHNNSHIIGSNITSISANTTHVEKLNVGTLNGTTPITPLGIDSNGMLVDATPIIGFTGNTSGSCITDLYVSNINSCSPLNILPNSEGDITMFSDGVVVKSVSGTTFFGINIPSPSYGLHMGGDMYLPSGSVGIGESPDPTQKVRITTTDADGTNTTALRVDLSQINAGGAGINSFAGIQVRSVPAKTFTGITQQWGIQSNLTSTVSATGNHMVVGGRFRASSTNADNFGIQIEDGTEVAGRVLVCQPTSLYGQSGLAHWEDVSSLSGVVSKYAADISFTGGTPQTITHSLGSTDVQIQLKDGTGARVIEDVSNNYTSNTVDMEVSITGTYRVIIIG